MSDGDAIVLNFHESLLRESDLSLLRGPHWLNDNLISFYLEYLENVVCEDRRQSLIFVSPEVTQCLKLVDGSDFGTFLEPLDFASKDYALFVLNDNESAKTAGGSHWSLLVYSKPERTFFYLNSIEQQGICEEARVLFRNFQLYFESVGTLGERPKIVPLECLRQTNGYDCGIHVICNIDKIISHVLEHGKIKPHWSIDEESERKLIKNKRGELISTIEKLSKKTGRNRTAIQV